MTVKCLYVFNWMVMIFMCNKRISSSEYAVYNT